MRVDDETMKHPVTPQIPMTHRATPNAVPLELAPTRKLRASRPVEDTLVLASISGITPIPVRTQDDVMIDAAWFRHFYSWLDRASSGRAKNIIPLLSFLVIGGSASVVNLVIIFAFDLIDHTNHNQPFQHFIYSAIATEISLLYNFMLNDRFTFRALVDQRRTWLQRCIRFHGPASVGFSLTLTLSTLFLLLLTNVTHNKNFSHAGVISQAMAIILVTAVNFTMHRFWTYRPKKDAIAPAH